MSTKIITVAVIPPSESSGSDYNKGAPLNATEFDQNIVNLRAAVDRRALAATPTFTGVVTLSDTTESSSTSTGCLVLAGGLGLAKKLTGVNAAFSGAVSTGAMNTAKLYSFGAAGAASIANAIQRVHCATDVSLNIGAIAGSPYGIWLQTCDPGSGTYPISLNPAGGSVLMGSTTSATGGAAKLEVNGGLYVGGGSAANITLVGSAYTALTLGQRTDDATLSSVFDTVSSGGFCSLRNESGALVISRRVNYSDAMTKIAAFSSTGLAVTGGITATAAGGNAITIGSSAAPATMFGLRWLDNGGITPGAIGLKYDTGTGVSTMYWHSIYNQGVKGESDVAMSLSGSGNLSVAGSVRVSALPTTDPHVAGAFWRSTNTVMVSTG